MNKNSILIISVVAITMLIAFKFMPHPSNFAPISAIVMFTAVYYSNKWSSLFASLGGLLICDVILEIINPGTGFYASQLFVYGAYVLIHLYGRFVKKLINWPILVLSPIVSTIIFFIVSNFGCWAVTENMYPHSFSGLVTCYVEAIPFIRNSFLSDILYTSILFGAFYLSNQNSFVKQSA